MIRWDFANFDQVLHLWHVKQLYVEVVSKELKNQRSVFVDNICICGPMLSFNVAYVLYIWSLLNLSTANANWKGL